MSEVTDSVLAELISITQEGFDDGVQEILLHFDNKRVVKQKWEWPDLKFRGSDDTESAYKLFEKAQSANIDVNIVYGIITTTARQVDGEELEVVPAEEQ